ncbi:Peptide-N4-(N-acetyl-beta-glucosaminyl)asparagine amidase A [Daldinia childiae]|uniref:Peptide-N4-(N-acetyl-beta- glucosaminyl)asparagine amidase A n=1 Tax=Daldinia childiae TaxID=326645 RepID=UPI0014472147|nr:Peptide-N4-(N-acetyl-beta-glucosaminyl)asparagine amidase A [Daldinia childiae]KAF3070397.1 Peptide-N4-(N-acetyl-beta-glucosaminyl)asparagine amidase A [Daldinia childiae]
MTIWHPLLAQNQKIILDLGNLIDGDRYTGFFNVTLEALYYDDKYAAGFRPAQHIYPISAQSSSNNTTSLFSLPSDSGSVDLTIPRNAKNAIVSVMASGNGAEEFWFTNVPSEYANTFPGNEEWLYGYSPFREVQVLIDGELAGVSWPFPILFTGGVDPGAWRPIVGIDAFELPSFEIDISPWLGLITDGQSHTFQVRVVGFDTSAEDGIGPVGENWWVSGSVFVWLDDTVEQTIMQNFKSSITTPSFDFHPVVGTAISDNGTATNTSLYFSLIASRNITVSSIIESGNTTREVAWTQRLSFSNIQNMTDLAFNQSLAMVASGSYSDSTSNVVSHHTYPFNLFSAYDVASSGATSNPGSVFCMADRRAHTYLLRYVTSRREPRESLDRITVFADYEEVHLDIVAVHGLGAHPYYSWKANAPPSDSSGAPEGDEAQINWLEHDDFLKKDFKNVRILSYSYNADWFVDASLSTASQKALTFLETLSEFREKTKKTPPILFIGHSFGGILIKYAIYSAHSDSRFGDISRDTAGIIFLGTPHQGSTVSWIGEILARLTILSGSDATLLKLLSHGSPELLDLKRDFSAAVTSIINQKPLLVYSFYETLPTFRYGVSLGVIVGPQSATLDFGKHIPVNTDHSGLNKCKTRKDDLYVKICSAIQNVKSILQQHSGKHN